MTDATAGGVTATLHAGAGVARAATRPEDLAEPGTKLPRRGRTVNKRLGREVPVVVEGVERDAEGEPWRVTVSMDGARWVEKVPADRTRDEAVEVAWRELTLRATELLPPQEA